MSDDTIIILVVVTIAASYQVFVSFLVMKCRFIEPKSRNLQLLLIWLIPLIGALLSHAVVQSHRSQSNGDDSLVKHYEDAEEYVLGPGKRSRNSSHDRGDADGDE